MTNEVYSLRLDHYMVDDEGDRFKLEEPLAVQMIIDRRTMPVPVCLNRMLDMMREEVLRRTND